MTSRYPRERTEVDRKKRRAADTTHFCFHVSLVYNRLPIRNNMSKSFRIFRIVCKSNKEVNSEHEFLVSFVFFFSSFLNEVTEDGFCLPRLPPVHVLARCSAAWQFNVVPDRARIRRLGRRAILSPAASASFFNSSHAHYPMFMRPSFSVGQASLWPAMHQCMAPPFFGATTIAKL
jgi:hypothetical protein